MRSENKPRTLRLAASKATEAIAAACSDFDYAFLLLTIIDIICVRFCLCACDPGDPDSIGKIVVGMKPALKPP